MYYYHNSICKKMEKEKIRCWFIFLFISMLLLSCESTEESSHHKPFIYLNHVYLTLDSTTYSSICNSDFLKDNFANCVTKTGTADSNQSWTVTYIWGENTNIELFVTGEAENKGFSGIGFGVDIENGIDSLYKHCTSLGIKNVNKGLKYRQIEDRKIPWFYLLSFSIEDSTAMSMLNTWAWVMEYNYEYMKFKYPEKNPDSLKITRKYYNQKSYRSDLLLKDIVEIELALNEFDYNRIFEELKNYGYHIEQKGELIIGNGPDIKIILRAKFENKSGICRIKFSLTDKQYEQQTVLFGTKSKLILNTDRTAEWYFYI